MKKLIAILFLSGTLFAGGPPPTDGGGGCSGPAFVFVGWLYGLPIFTVLPGSC